MSTKTTVCVDCGTDAEHVLADMYYCHYCQRCFEWNEELRMAREAIQEGAVPDVEWEPRKGNALVAVSWIVGLELLGAGAILAALWISGRFAR